MCSIASPSRRITGSLQTDFAPILSCQKEHYKSSVTGQRLLTLRGGSSVGHNQEPDTSRTFPAERGFLLIKQHHFSELDTHIRTDFLTVVTTEGFNLWEYDAVYTDKKSQLIFRRDISLPSSETKNNLSKKSARNRQQATLNFFHILLLPLSPFSSISSMHFARLTIFFSFFIS
jgi:hypothetical protein